MQLSALSLHRGIGWCSMSPCLDCTPLAGLDISAGCTLSTLVLAWSVTLLLRLHVLSPHGPRKTLVCGCDRFCARASPAAAVVERHCEIRDSEALLRFSTSDVSYCSYSVHTGHDRHLCRGTSACLWGQ